MEYDDVLTRNNDGELSVRTVSSSGDNYVNPNDVYTRDSEGKLCIRTTGSGGSIDESRIIIKSDTIPAASQEELGKFYCYSGVTSNIFHHGFVYECVEGDPTYSDTTTFEPATISGTVVTTTDNALANLASEYITGADITEITNGTLTYDESGNLLVFVGKDAEDNTVGTFQIYTEDYQDAGFTFTGTLEDGDVIAFECTITESSTYTWTRINLQPAGEHDLGYYETVLDLQTAHPTGVAGDFALVGATDTFWIWDTATSAWVDSHKTDAVTSVNGETGAVQIKSINGNSVMGSGNLELSTYLPYPAGWTTTGTTKAFCDDIAADTTAIVGKAYLGEVTLTDLPASMVNAEIVVEIMAGTTAQNKVIVLTCTSGNTAPYMWKYTYWDNGTNVSGWKGFTTINDNSTNSLVETWSASKLNTMIGDVETLLSQI